MEYLIRKENDKDYKEVEQITRDAFWNLYIPGCTEHYLVHTMRSHKDFIPELSLVIENKGEIIGNIMYTKAKLLNKEQIEIPILTFGPLCIKKEYQRNGLGKKLMEHSFEIAISLGYSIIVIFGNPGNYVTSGFKSCARYGIFIEQELYPSAMIVKVLDSKSIPEGKWKYIQSDVLNIDHVQAELFDSAFPQKEKRVMPEQEEFYILSHSSIGTSCI
jgi:putative acetyltransferase